MTHCIVDLILWLYCILVESPQFNTHIWRYWSYDLVFAMNILFSWSYSPSWTNCSVHFFSFQRLNKAGAILRHTNRVINHLLTNFKENFIRLTLEIVSNPTYHEQLSFYVHFSKPIQTFRSLPGNPGSWFSVCNLILTQLDEIWRKKYRNAE